MGSSVFIQVMLIQSFFVAPTNASFHISETVLYSFSHLLWLQMTHVAAQYGQTAFLCHIVTKWNADPDVPDNDGRSPLHWYLTNVIVVFCWLAHQLCNLCLMEEILCELALILFGKRLIVTVL